MQVILRPDYIQDLLEETKHEPAQDSDMVHPILDLQPLDMCFDQLEIIEPCEPPKTTFLDESEPVREEYD
jgi:hypothetical protein